MTGYRLCFTHEDVQTVDALTDLDELAERVALEQLAHELNPVEPAGYVVTFRAVDTGCSIAAAGHFYVRAAAAVASAVERENNPS